ncbi:TolC family protein [Pelagicoccus sp. SDUM812002]|uniref:TolC family protein n=1 Tax=Pelagicoccus sp. SDUM812002 TaxID=3041266 RepID=UPI00280E7947|nr:TolC family protein [Pelagicoccus sp. SDUM812002]MDQ8184894.1 TolC family protein [Pelagicoccus sp. SDUM812002]
MKPTLSILLATTLLGGCASVSETPPLDPATIIAKPEDRSITPYFEWNPRPLSVEGETLTLSIEDAIFTALERNRELRIQTLEPVISGAFELIERGQFQPELYGVLQAGEEEVSENSRATGEQFSVTGRDARGEIGIRQNLASGTDIEVSVEQDRSISNRTPEQQEARLGLSVTQSLLRGFGPAVNLASIRQAKLDTLASQYELRGYVEAFVAEVESAYWQYVLAREEIAIFDSSLELARRERDEIAGRIEVGSLSQTDGALSRGEVARRESALIDANAYLDAQRFRLVRLLNANLDGSLDFQITASSEPDVDHEPLHELEERIELALNKRPDLNEARLRLAQDRLETIVTKNGLLPRLELFVTLGKTGYADTFVDSFENIQDDSYDVTAGLRFNQFIGNSANRGRDIIARANREQAADAVLNHEQIVRLDVRLAANEVERARQQIEATAQIRIHLEETVQGEVERLEVGSTTALQVAAARRDLLASRIQEVEALISYRLALIDLYLAEGSLLERRGISLP